MWSVTGLWVGVHQGPSNKLMQPCLLWLSETPTPTDSTLYDFTSQVILHREKLFINIIKWLHYSTILSELLFTMNKLINQSIALLQSPCKCDLIDQLIHFFFDQLKMFYLCTCTIKYYNYIFKKIYNMIHYDST